MDRATFEADLRSRGFQEIVEGGMPPNQTRDAHHHDFEVRGLILEGELQLGCDGTVSTYGPGDVFIMSDGHEHTERTGGAGFRSVVGRKRRAI